MATDPKEGGGPGGTLGVRHEREVAHGRELAARGAEGAWGWETPAGRIRAERRAELIARGAGLGPDVAALEIGCGTGLFTERFAATGARLTAVDISPDLLDLARRRGLPDQVTFHLGSFEDAVLRGPYDAVVGSSVLHHLSLDLALQRIHAILRPGGRLSFAEPNMLNPQVYVTKHLKFLFPEESPDETAFVRFAVRRRLVAAGFDDVAVVPFDWLHPALSERWIPLVSRAGRSLERIWAIREFSGSLLITARRAD
jgi:2-polyprenyl-3-methyl-5-hydroxy-6-metoxy-1,4-benzoquinol methylase